MGEKMVSLNKKGTIKDALMCLEEKHAKLQASHDKLRKSEEKYRDLLEKSSDIICFLDSSGIITSINKKGLALLGYTLKEVVGQHFLSFIPDEYQEDFLIRFKKSLKGNTDVFELVFKKKSGGLLVLSMNSGQIRDESNIKGIIFIARDITKELEVESRMLEAEKIAAKGIILSEIAQVIGNSITNIETSLFICKHHLREDVLKDIYEEMERISRTVSGVLATYCEDDSAIRPVDINAEIVEVINITERMLRGKGISIISNLSPGLPHIPCCPGHIKQILLNLIKNAEEAMYSGNKRLIVISTEEEGDIIKIDVSDTGCGSIPEEKIKKVFSPLFTSKADGAGLGLSICRDITQKYGGDIKIESKGIGTTISVSLPINRYG